jgi:predicted nucleic acid-binding protein
VIVADTNLVVYLFIPSEFTERARQVHALDPDWMFPPIAMSEAANVLATLSNEKWITPETAYGALEHIEKCIISGIRDVSMRAALELAIQKRISVYDAQFIVLARSMGVHLITQDGRLKNKFPEVALSMEAFIERGKDWTVRESRATYRVRRKKRRGITSIAE